MRVRSLCLDGALLVVVVFCINGGGGGGAGNGVQSVCPIRGRA